MRSGRPALALLVLGALAAPAGAQQAEPAERSPLAFWSALGDSTLARLVGEALEANHDLRALEARVGEASATRTEAALDLAPVVTASAGYSRQRMAGVSFPGAPGRLPEQDLWDAGVQLSWDLDLFGRLRHSLSGRSELLASARQDVRDVQVVVAAEVSRAYFDLRGAQDRLAVAERNAENQRRTLEITVDRLEAGRGNALDTERARAQLASTLAAVPAHQAEILAQRHRLGVLLGRSPAALAAELEAAGPEGAACPLPLPDELVAGDLGELVRRRPDVLAAEHRMAASEEFADAARVDYLPRLTIGAFAGYTAGTAGALGDPGTSRYAIGPVVSWPLLDIGRVKTRVDAARAAEAEAAARYEQAVLLAREEVETALARYDAARERLVHLEEAAAASERATELARLRFEEGVTDFLEVLDAERRLLEAQDRLAAGRTEATGWLVAVYRALGGSLPDPAAAVR